jgi:hypothetical protein
MLSEAGLDGPALGGSDQKITLLLPGSPLTQPSSTPSGTATVSAGGVYKGAAPTRESWMWEDSSENEVRLRHLFAMIDRFEKDIPDDFIAVNGARSFPLIFACFPLILSPISPVFPQVFSQFLSHSSPVRLSCSLSCSPHISLISGATAALAPSHRPCRIRRPQATAGSPLRS